MKIKFRVFDKICMNYLEPADLALVVLGANGTPYKMYPTTDKDDFTCYELEWGSASNYILEQYTGLKDKNGVEVYDGDRYLNGETKLKGKLFYQESPVGGYELWCEEKQDNGEPYNHCRFGDLDLTDFEVIGNVHQEEL